MRKVMALGAFVIISASWVYFAILIGERFHSAFAAVIMCGVGVVTASVVALGITQQQQ